MAANNIDSQFEELLGKALNCVECDKQWYDRAREQAIAKLIAATAEPMPAELSLVTTPANVLRIRRVWDFMTAGAAAAVLVAGAVVAQYTTSRTGDIPSSDSFVQNASGVSTLAPMGSGHIATIGNAIPVSNFSMGGVADCNGASHHDLGFSPWGILGEAFGTGKESCNGERRASN